MNTISNSTLFNFLESLNKLVINYNPFYKSRLYGPISKVSDLEDGTEANLFIIVFCRCKLCSTEMKFNHTDVANHVRRVHKISFKQYKVDTSPQLYQLYQLLLSNQ